MKQLRAIFIGTVQGVGFRATAKRHADALHLTGYARNLKDGSVELCAQGEEEDLQKLLANLRELFKNHLEHVDAHFAEAKEHYSTFSVL